MSDDVNTTTESSVPVTLTEEAVVTVELGVPDSMVPRILGSKGSGIRKLVQATGCSRIKVSQRDQFLEGTDQRIVFCTGTAEAVSKAEARIKDMLDKKAANK